MPLTSPLISVVIPAYNCERTIRETLNSVFQQTYSNFEVIVINDGSVDNTLAILDTFQDLRLKVFTYPNAGVSTTRNRGINKASGEFIAFLDADDVWLPQKLEEQLQVLEAHSEAALAYSWTDYIDEASNFLRAGLHVRYSGQVYSQLLRGCFLENGSTPLVRVQMLAKVGEFEPALAPCEDWDMWLRLAKHYAFALVPKVHVLYRVSTGSASFNLVKHEMSALAVIDRHASDNKSVRTECLARLYKYLTFKVLDSSQVQAQPQRHQFWVSLKYLLKYLTYKPVSVFQEPKVILSGVIRALLLVTLPPKQSSKFLSVLRQRQVKSS